MKKFKHKANRRMRGKNISFQRVLLTNKMKETKTELMF